MMSISGGIAFTTLWSHRHCLLPRHQQLQSRSGPNGTEEWDCRLTSQRVTVELPCGLPPSRHQRAQPATVGPVLARSRDTSRRARKRVRSARNARECLQKRSCREADTDRQECRFWHRSSSLNESSQRSV